jgi:hypothetical protein
MSTDFRALCAELLQPLAEYDGANPYHEHRALITRARAALAAEPEGEGPTAKELLAMRSWSSHGPTFDSDLVDFGRAILARWGRPAAPPAPEAVELGILLRVGESCGGGAALSPEQCRRAATLLQQLSAPAPAVVPVAVSERPWEWGGWRDAEGRCWWGRPSEELCDSDWYLATPDEIEEFCSECMPIVSLPHNAIPYPRPGEWRREQTTFPPAQAALDAFHRGGLAAALRAAAYQMINVGDLTDDLEDIIRGAERHHQAGRLCTIAAELEAPNV